MRLGEGQAQQGGRSPNHEFNAKVDVYKRQVITYTYDDFGNVKTENNNGVINTYTYDADGNRKTFNQKEGNTTYINASYTYDNLNRVTKISHSNGISANYTYDANDRVIEEVNNNVENKYTYNKGGTLFNITTTSTLNDVFEGTAIYLSLIHI